MTVLDVIYTFNSTFLFAKKSHSTGKLNERSVHLRYVKHSSPLVWTQLSTQTQ